MIKGKLIFLNDTWVIKYTETKMWQPPHAPGVFGPTYTNWTDSEIRLHPDDIKYIQMFKDMAGGFMYNNTQVDFSIVDLDGEQFATIDNVKITTMEWEQIYKEYKNSLLHDNRFAQEGLLSWLKQYYNPPSKKQATEAPKPPLPPVDRILIEGKEPPKP